MGARIFIGTSGWHYKHWRELFYPKELPTSAWLEFYSELFNSVELNNSFYHLPSLTAFDTWRETTPTRFRFAVKGSRFITHMKKLKDPESSTPMFFAGANRLQRKLGPVLFQLPPRWKANPERLEEFLSSIERGHQYAFEFRDDSWYTGDVYEVLKRYNTALCIHDLGGKQSPIEITASFTYIRFHGPTEAKYSGSYSDAQLEDWAKRFNAWRSKLKEIYAYFNNDVGGHAPKNAMKLRSLIERS
jgi:uncharacterized protein YecE (DUF72 family)